MAHSPNAPVCRRFGLAEHRAKRQLVKGSALSGIRCGSRRCPTRGLPCAPSRRRRYPLRTARGPMIAAALKAEADEYGAGYEDEIDEDGCRLVVRNGRARERKVTVGSGTIPVRAPRVNDKRVDERTGERKRFCSRVLPAYARRSPPGLGGRLARSAAGCARSTAGQRRPAAHPGPSEPTDARPWDFERSTFASAAPFGRERRDRASFAVSLVSHDLRSLAPATPISLFVCHPSSPS
jgi:hypothetical protein